MTTDDRIGAGPPAAPDPAPLLAPFAAREIRHVLVPLDGSSASEQALPYAAAVARRTGARVTLAHVREDPDGGEGTPAAYPAPLLDDPRLAGSAEATAETLRGAPLDALLAFADAGGVDLIVMTSRGRSGIGRALFGSVADAVVRSAEIPVLLVKPREDDPALDPALDGPMHPLAPPLLRVLLPLDGSEAAERIVPYVLALTGPADAHYVLLRVHPALTPDGRLAPGPVLGPRIDEGDDGYLSSTAPRLADLGVLVSTRSLTHASNADVILQVATDEAVDLVAMTTRGAGGAERMLFGSVADEVLRRSGCHVLVLRPRLEEETSVSDGAGRSLAPPGG